MRLAVTLLVLGPSCVETRTRALPSDSPTDPPPIETDAPEQLPIADAGEPRSIPPLTTVSLDGTGSFDPLATSFFPQWTVTASPPGSQASIDRPDSLQPQVFIDMSGTYTFSLVIRTADGRVSIPDQVQFEAVPDAPVYVQLRWDTATDLDIHAVPVTEALWGSSDCTWCNPTPGWGSAATSEDDPSLDWDSQRGFGPETITTTREAQSFDVFVDFYGKDGLTNCPGDVCPPTVAHVDVYIDGIKTSETSVTLGEAGDLWHASVVHPATGRVETPGEISKTTIDSCQGSED